MYVNKKDHLSIEKTKNGYLVRTGNEGYRLVEDFSFSNIEEAFAYIAAAFNDWCMTGELETNQTAGLYQPRPEAD